MWTAWDEKPAQNFAPVSECSRGCYVDRLGRRVAGGGDASLCSRGCYVGRDEISTKAIQGLVVPGHDDESAKSDQPELQGEVVVGAAMWGGMRPGWSCPASMDPKFRPKRSRVSSRPDETRSLLRVSSMQPCYADRAVKINDNNVNNCFERTRGCYAVRGDLKGLMLSRFLCRTRGCYASRVDQYSGCDNVTPTSYAGLLCGLGCLPLLAGADDLLGRKP